MNKPNKHEREFYDIVFDLIYTKDENERRVSLNTLLQFILPALRQAHHELNHYLIEEDNRNKRTRGQQTPAPTTGMDMLEKIEIYIDNFYKEVELYERTRRTL